MMKSVSPYEEPLRKLRGNLAHKSQMEPFKVFNDEMLRALLEKKPRTLEELATVKGFPKGGARVTKYGTDIIGVFNKNYTSSAAVW